MTPTDRPRIELRSDNSAGVAPEIMAAVGAADVGASLAYGADPWTARLHARAAEVFEHDDVSVFPVSTGTAANALGLSAMCPPWGAVLCHETAHICASEAGATSLFTGAVMRPLPGDSEGRLTPATVEAALAAVRWGETWHSQPAVVSVTQPTDLGTLYPPQQMRAIADVARSRGLRVHVDGARLANAIASLGCSPADLTWRAGADVVTLGATKNGVMTTDAIVCFDPALREELSYRLRRAGQVASKMRYQSAQLDAYLTDGLWLRLAALANEGMARLVSGLIQLGVQPLHHPRANMVFVQSESAIIDAWVNAGIDLFRTATNQVRFVTNFRTTPEEIDDALARMGACLSEYR
jgi:threonine aldolase